MSVLVAPGARRNQIKQHLTPKNRAVIVPSPTGEKHLIYVNCGGLAEALAQAFQTFPRSEPDGLILLTAVGKTDDLVQTITRMKPPESFTA